jgi:hypothetical protein
MMTMQNIYDLAVIGRRAGIVGATTAASRTLCDPTKPRGGQNCRRT